MIYPILQYPDQQLKKVSEPVTIDYIKSEEAKIFRKDIVETLLSKKTGVGIAAPQVGQCIQMIVVLEKDKTAEVLYNPIIIASYGKVKSREGCLSVAGFSGFVKRHKEIVVHALDEVGEVIKFKVRGRKAIIIQHEVDHLYGVEFTDVLLKDDMKRWKDYSKRRGGNI